MARTNQVSFNFTAVNQVSPWLMHDPYQVPFNVTLGVYFGFGLAATLAVEFLLDDYSVGALRQAVASQAANTITVVDDPGPQVPSNNTHGLIVGDTVRFAVGSPFGAGGVGDNYDFNVATVTSAQSYTLTSTIAQAVPLQPVNLYSGRLFTHSILNGLVARASSNYAYPVWGSRLVCTAFTTAGYGYLVATQGSQA